MKVGIITIEQVNNYGAELQATATQRFLCQMGYDAEIIDYCYYKTWNFKDTQMSEPFVPMGIRARFMYWVKYRLIGFIASCVLPLFYKKVADRNKRFKQFHIENTKMSRRYMSMAELYKAKMDYDIYMVGSDQVWNPAAKSSIEPYFLTFAPVKAKKVAYASSFGVSKIPTELEKLYTNLLINIDCIGVREQSGVELVNKMIDKNAELVLDPTLLLTEKDWMTMMKPYPNMPKKYILVYQLLPSNTLPSFAMKLAEENGCEVCYLSKRAYGIVSQKGMKMIPDAGPAEFLSFISNAICVITNSFHGVAFSVNFGTPFFAVLNPNRDSNARIESLLVQLGLKDRVVFEGENYTNIKIGSLDKTALHNKLSFLRQKSVNYLKYSLDN